MLELVIAVSVAVLVSAGCSLAEAVLYSVPPGYVEVLHHTGKWYGVLFKKLRDNIEHPIAAILMLNTIANTAGASYAGSAAATLLGDENLAFFSAFFTMCILILAEIVPKTAGVVFSKPLMPIIVYPLKILVTIMTPFIWMSTLITRLISKNKVDHEITAEEIRSMARLSLKAGEIKPYQEDIIKGILTLQNHRVKDVMTPRTVVFSLSEHLTLEEASKKAVTWEHSRFPVYDRDTEDIVGIVLTKELFIALSKGEKDSKLAKLIRSVHFVAETESLSNVLIDFLERRQHLFVVLDEYGGLSGIISLEDIIEEILGREIIDESDKVSDKRELARMRRKNIISRI